MGYKPGTSLGKAGTGIVEPVAIVLKAGRGGLGREAAVQRLMEHKQRLMEKRAAEMVAAFNPHAFRWLSCHQIFNRLCGLAREEENSLVFLGFRIFFCS